MEEDGPSLIRGGSDSRTLYTQDKFNLCREISVLECTSRPKVAIGVLPTEYSGLLLLPQDPSSSISTILLNRALAAIIKEFPVPLQALFQRSPCITYNRVSYFTLPPHLLHRITNRPQARVTTGIHPEEGRPHESNTGPCWRT